MIAARLLGMVAFYVAALVIAGHVGDDAFAADLPREVHGSGDAYAAGGVALAWGVLRGANESATTVVIRIATDPGVYAMAAAVGIDPFTQSRQTRLAATKVDRAVDLRVPRSSFADLPRTEFRFFSSGADAQADVPQLVVYFLGVPDTTPEFAEPAALDAYLAGRIERARMQKGSP
ncbi:MAG TPA: hypothetical protein VEO36_02600 [Casimicrobiaceae bacterium]|nr:hypothetical protein [Casimicrobiaceae bacterium]